MKRISLLMIMLLLLLSSLAQATTYYIATTGNNNNPGTQAQPFKTIAKGISTAVSGDTLLLANGTYNEHNLDFGTKNLVLQSQSNNPAACILDCQQAGRGIRIEGGQDATTTVGGLTIQNGSVPDSADAGGMLIVNASPKIINCVFTGNTNTYNNYQITASALFVNGSSSLTLTGCTFQNHGGPYNGLSGTIVLFYGTRATITNSNFSGNSVSIGGGGIYMFPGSINGRDCTLTLRGCAFTNNVGAQGGAIDMFSGTLIADRCLFTGNLATGRIFYGGGGIHAHSGDLTLTNCLFVNNNNYFNPQRPVVGQSIEMEAATARIINSTFIAPMADHQANIVATGANLTMVNNIVSSLPWGGITFNLSQCSVSITYSNTQYPFPGTGNINTDPKFVNPAGGDYRLQSTSSCLNTGNAAAPGLPATDLGGFPRILGSAPDMGAYEFWSATNGVWFVDKASGSDTNNGSPLAPFKTVVKAINTASNGHKIYIKQGNYGTDRPRITKSLRLFNWLDTGLSRVGQP